METVVLTGGPVVLRRRDVFGGDVEIGVMGLDVYSAT